MAQNQDLHRVSRKTILPGKRGKLSDFETHMVNGVHHYHLLKNTLKDYENVLLADREQRGKDFDFWERELGTLEAEVMEKKHDISNLEEQIMSLQTEISLFDTCQHDVHSTMYSTMDSKDLFELQNKYVKSMGLCSNEILNRLKSQTGPTSKWMMSSCGICCDEEKIPDAVLSCGHSMCQDCASRLTHCATCMQPIESISKLFGLLRQ
jgi:hypothetical protein